RASEARLERDLDLLANVIGEITGAEIDPDSTAEDRQQNKERHDRAGKPAKTTPHRAFALALTRRNVMPVGRGRVSVYVHSDSRNEVLTTSQKIEISQV